MQWKQNNWALGKLQRGSIFPRAQFMTTPPVSRGMHCGAGRPPILTAEEEKAIVQSCQELAQLGFGVDRFLVGKVVHDFLLSQKRETPFRDGMPGTKWWQGFLQRWPTLRERNPQHFPANRASVSSPKVMDEYLKKLEVRNNNKIITSNWRVSLSPRNCSRSMESTSFTRSE